MSNSWRAAVRAWQAVILAMNICALAVVLSQRSLPTQLSLACTTMVIVFACVVIDACGQHDARSLPAANIFGLVGVRALAAALPAVTQLNQLKICPACWRCAPSRLSRSGLRAAPVGLECALCRRKIARGLACAVRPAVAAHGVAWRRAVVLE